MSWTSDLSTDSGLTLEASDRNHGAANTQTFHQANITKHLQQIANNNLPDLAPPVGRAIQAPVDLLPLDLSLPDRERRERWFEELWPLSLLADAAALSLEMKSTKEARHQGINNEAMEKSSDNCIAKHKSQGTTYNKNSLRCVIILGKSYLHCH